MAELFTNMARSTLATSMNSTQTILTVQSGDGNKLFPALVGSDFFRCIIFKRSTGDVEIVRITSRSGDTFSIVRAQESVGNLAATAFSFDAGDIVELRPTAAFFDSLGNVTTTDIQSWSYNYSPDTGVANAYKVTLSPAPAAYASPMIIAFMPNSSSTGVTATIEVNNLGIVGLRRPDGFTLRALDITQNKVALVSYDTSNFTLLNPRSTGQASAYTFDDDISIGGHAYFKSIYNYGNLTDSAATINWQYGNKQKCALAPTVGTNVALSFVAPVGPTDLRLTIVQAGAGNKTVTWPSSARFVGGVKPILSTASGAIDIASMYWDGANYFISLTKAWAP